MSKQDAGSGSGDVPEKDTQVQPSNNGSGAPDTQNVDADKSRKAAQLGESRKAYAESLFSLAKTSPEALEKVKELSQDEYNKQYFEEKFGDEFRNLVASQKPEEKANAEPSEDQQKIDRLFAESEAQRLQRINDAKKEINLSTEKAESFDQLVSMLEGSELGGRKLSFDDAISMAKRQLSPDLPSGINPKANVIDRPESPVGRIDIGLSEERIKSNAHRTGAKSADDFAPIVEQMAEKGSFNLPLPK